MLVSLPYKGYSIDSESGIIFSHKRNHFLSTFENNKGYARTDIYVEGKKVRLFNHITLVAFVGDCNGNTFDETKGLRISRNSIDHLNNNKMDPSRSNLEIVTHAENCKRKYSRDCEIEDL